ncbi:hypothetical protein [Chryseobacterium gwangjuense]|uniref:hypothetical protein n=1 Tax=Chryseobacterium gwangjuense TaxID=1069980 RepID=UPI001E5CC923|nr:hypothetical protein [Chryseobacterium gwangjuense]MCE3077066.1 hypothetical protein [Chryseobacterium gwangjuense]
MNKNQNELNSVVDVNEQNENRYRNKPDNIDWKKMKIYEQVSDKEADFDIYRNKGGQKGNWNDPITSKMPAEDAFQMLQEFYSTVSDKYEKRMFITSEVARDLFENNETIKIFLGENNDGLFFMSQDANENYSIISNCEAKEDITEDEFSNYKSVYDANLKATLDEYIQEKRNDETARNTKRFILGNIVYNELLTQQEEKPTANIVISFYPAIHMRDIDSESLSYKNRFTFIMILEERNGTEFTPMGETGVFDRNGLCPPPNESNC